MNFINHWNLKGKHSFLSASKYHWVNYDKDKLYDTFLKYKAAQKGTRLHDIAASCIEEKIKLQNNKQTLNSYVNDAIRFGMTPEVILYYSDNCFGTADCISFKNKKLRIHDLKTGVTPASMCQLEIYAAIFCLEYDYAPGDIKIELRLYQNDDVIIEEPEVDTIGYIMDKIITFDKFINSLKENEEGFMHA